MIAIALLAGAVSIATCGKADARFGAGVIADAVATMQTAEPAQYRHSRRSYRRTYSPAPYTSSQSGTVSPYRYPGSRGALDSCSFC